MGNERRVTLFLVLAAAILAAFFIPLVSAKASQAIELRVSQASVDKEGENPPRIFVFLEFLENGKCVIPDNYNNFSVILGNETPKSTKANRFTEGSAIVLLLDTSKSLSAPMFNALKQGVAQWINDMRDEDCVALIGFGAGIDSDTRVDFTGNRQKLLGILDNIKQNDGSTALNRAVITGLNLAGRDDKNLPRRRAVIVFTDGVDDAISSSTREMLQDAMKKNMVPIYALLYPYSGASSANNIITNFQNRINESGGWYCAFEGSKTSTAKQLRDSLNELKRRIWGVVSIESDVSNIRGDGAIKNLQITWKDGPLAVRSNIINIAYTNNIPHPPDIISGDAPIPPPGIISGDASMPPPDPFPMWIWIILGIVILGIIGISFMVWYRKKLKKQPMSASLDEPLSMAMEASDYNVSNVTSSEGEIILTAVSEGGHSRTYRRVFHGSVIIGRSSSPGVLTIQGDIHVSLKHCEIFTEEDRFMIRDLGSTNGTIVNGSNLTKHQRINDGDVLVLGATELRVKLPRATYAGESSSARKTLI
ncbi:MAG: FHA domain-containing protein [Synergistaceae bacterium]|jgi:hypothetical protein|nr:FHA domain-containing protein [Synergistaceae bacterium]